MKRVLDLLIPVGLLATLPSAAAVFEPTGQTEPLDPAVELTVEKLARDCNAGEERACRRIADMARTYQDPRVRRLAVEGLTDQAMLADIARNDESQIIRRAAVKNLTDKAVLADIATNDTSEDVREAADRQRDSLKVSLSTVR